MNELSARTKDLLSAARVAMAPLPEDRERVRAALDLKLATLAAATSGSGLAAKGALKGAAVAASAGATVKVAVVFALSAALGGTGMHYGLKAVNAPLRPEVGATAAPAAGTPALPRVAEASPALAVVDEAPPAPAARGAVAAPVAERPAVVVAGREGAPATPDVPDAPSSATRTDFRAAPCTMAQELASLRPAQQALAANEPQKAIDLLAPYFQSCVSGALEPEAHAARALALCQLEQVAQAQPDLEWLKAKGALRPKLLKTCSALPRLER